MTNEQLRMQLLTIISMFEDKVNAIEEGLLISDLPRDKHINVISKVETPAGFFILDDVRFLISQLTDQANVLTKVKTSDD